MGLQFIWQQTIFVCIKSLRISRVSARKDEILSMDTVKEWIQGGQQVRSLLITNFIILAYKGNNLH